MGVQTLQKKKIKKITSKRFYQKIDKSPKPIFLDFLLSRFWAFVGEGSSKTNFIFEQTNFGPLFASDPPAHHGVTDFILAVGGPLLAYKGRPKERQKKIEKNNQCTYVLYLAWIVVRSTTA
jgi:hypothetical protein